MVLCVRSAAFSCSPIDLITSHTTGLRPVLAADPSTKRDCIRLDHATYLELAANYQPSSFEYCYSRINANACISSNPPEHQSSGEKNERSQRTGALSVTSSFLFS